MSKFYIGIGHKARQGKDTLAREFHALRPRTSRIIGFADALKAYCRVHHGMTTKDAVLLQRVGMEMRDTRGEDFWIRALENTANEVAEDTIVIPDVRFPNEAEFVRSKGGLLVKVTRLNDDGTPFIATDRPADHPSEVALDGFDGWDYEVSPRYLLIHQRAGAKADKAFYSAFFHTLIDYAQTERHAPSL